MGIFSIFIINKAGGLIFQYDHYTQRPEVEKTFSFPIELVLKQHDEKLVVAFGERDGIKGETERPEESAVVSVKQFGHTLLAINGVPVEGRFLQSDGKDAMEIINSPQNYPINLKFGRTRLTTNERIMLGSMFHSLFAIGSQLSPEPHSSGIEVLETDGFKLHCYQTMTGIKFIALTDPRQGGVDILLRKMYEVFSDFALKNPFYSVDMPVRCDLFDTNLQQVIEACEKQGASNI